MKADIYDFKKKVATITPESGVVFEKEVGVETKKAISDWVSKRQVAVWGPTYHKEKFGIVSKGKSLPTFADNITIKEDFETFIQFTDCPFFVNFIK